MAVIELAAGTQSFLSRTQPLLVGGSWDVPIGDMKQSGIGRENTRDGLELYLQTKSVFTAV